MKSVFFEAQSFTQNHDEVSLDFFLSKRVRKMEFRPGGVDVCGKHSVFFELSITLDLSATRPL